MTMVLDTLLGQPLEHTHPEIPLAPITDTRANILAVSPTQPVFAETTDTSEILFWNGSAWLLAPFALVATSQNPDMGTPQESSPIGLHREYVDSKVLSHVRFGAGKVERDGGFIYDPFAQSGAGFFGRILGVWAKIVTGLVLRELESRLQFQPSGSSKWYDLSRMNSESIGVNGLPLTQDGQTSMGATPPPLIIDGGNATMTNPATATLLLRGTIFQIVPRRMTNAERLALAAGATAEGEHVYCTDTKIEWISDGVGGWTALG